MADLLDNDQSGTNKEEQNTVPNARRLAEIFGGSIDRELLEQMMQDPGTLGRLVSNFASIPMAEVDNEKEEEKEEEQDKQEDNTNQQKGSALTCTPVVEDKEEYHSNEEEEEEEEMEPAMVRDVSYSNGVPVYQENHLLMDARNYFKAVIFERIGFDDRVGGSYLALAHDKELVLRVEKETAMITTIEYNFLKKVESANQWRYFSQLHSTWKDEGYNYYMLYYRPGPGLHQIRQFMSYRPLSHGTVGRLGRDILKCIRIAHQHGMLIRCLNYDMFHFDAAGRNVFMSDISELRVDTNKKGVDVSVNWSGVLFAPLEKDAITCKDELEAWLYMVIDMVKGELPWTNARRDEVEEVKKREVKEEGTLFNGLPEQYRTLYNTISSIPKGSEVSEEVYNKLEELCKTIYEEIGGIRDMDDNFDFERQPTEAELPRFVMEKRPIEDGTNDTEPTPSVKPQ